MMETLREVQMAAALGYTEIEDFRRDLKVGKIPQPVSYLATNKRRPIWLKTDVEKWLGIVSDRKKRENFLDLVDQVA